MTPADHPNVAEDIGHNAGAAAYAGAIRWSRRGRYLDLLAALISYLFYEATGSTFWLASIWTAVALWVVDLALYWKLTHPRPPRR